MTSPDPPRPAPRGLWRQRPTAPDCAGTAPCPPHEAAPRDRCVAVSLRLVRAAFLAVLLAPAVALAQEAPADSAAVPAAAAAQPARPAPLASRAPRQRPDTTGLGVPVAPAAEGGLEQPVTFTAEDSLRITFARRDTLAEGQRADDRAALYGNARAAYDGAGLDAGVVEIFFGPEVLRARPLATPTGEVGVPRFSEGEDGFTGRELAYNLRTQRGRVVGARTQLDDGFLVGGVIKQASPHVIYASDAGYTTCDLEHPHYVVEAGRIKVVDGKTVYTGPVRLRLLGIPTPLWLPFGYFPATEGRRSGPLAVGYGRGSDYGLFLEDLGYFWAVSDYLGATVRGKIGTTGSVQATGRLDYARKYAYTGNVQLSYGRLRRGETDDLDFRIATPVRLGWTHSQTFPAGQTLRANVDLQSSSARFVADDLADQVSQSSRSSVTFNQTWPRSGRALTVQLGANQQFDLNSAQLTLPSLSFSQSRRFPFKRRTRDGRGERWYEKVSVEYRGRASNTYAYTPLADSLVAGGVPNWVDALFSADAFARGAAPEASERFAYAATHEVPIAANFSVPRYNLTITPSVRYTENWLDERTVQRLDPVTREIVRSEEAGFVFDRRVQASLNLRTELFGTSNVRVGALDGFRHVLRPSVSLVAQPDYAGPLFNTVRTVTDSTGRETRYGTVPGVPTQPIGGLTFSLDNAFLTRLVRTDSTGEESRRAVQLLSLGVSGGYNFAAQTRPIGNIAFNANSQAGRFRARLGGTFSPYARDSLGALSDVTLLAATGRPLRLEGLSFSTGFSFSSGRQRPAALRGEPALPAGPGSAVRPGTASGVDPAAVAAYDPERPSYSAFALPLGPRGGARFSAALDLTANYTPAIGTRDAQWTASLGVNQVNYQLTPLWGLTGSAAFDLARGEIATAAVALRRDLHCWEMQVRWTPIGPVRAFSVGLYLKSGYLRDLLRLELPNADFRSAFRNVALP